MLVFAESIPDRAPITNANTAALTSSHQGKNTWKNPGPKNIY